jgi:DNA-binding transcriptional LysR family regulator
LTPFRLFQDLATYRSFSRAAKENGISQSAASQQIQEIERQLMTELLDRSTRPFRLTEAGEAYLRFCLAVLDQERDLAAAIMGIQQRIEGVVRVACIYSIGLSEMTRLKQEFEARSPGVELEVEYLRPEGVYAAVEEGRADLGIVSYPRSTPEVAARPWREEEMVVAVSPRHPLARRREVVPFELNGVSFVAFDEELPIRRAIDAYLEQQLVRVEIALHFDNIAQIKEALTLGQTVSILPRPVLDADPGRLIGIPLGPPAFTRPVGILTPARRKLAPPAAAFLQLLEESEDLLTLGAS